MAHYTKRRPTRKKIYYRRTTSSKKKSTKKEDIDANDQKIIGVLRQDARASIREISQQTRVRPSTVYKRFQKLVRNEVIQKFTIKTDDRAMQESLLVIFLVKGSTQKYLTEGIFHDSRVKEVFGITGEYDLLLKMKFSDVQEFNDYIIEFRRKHPQILSTLTMVGTATLKEEL